MDPCFVQVTATAEHERLHDHYNTNDNDRCPACLQRDTETLPPVAATKPHNQLTLRRLGTVLLLCITLINSAYGCGPGRGLGGQRKYRKLTPLVLNQHVPNMPEKTLGASGMSEGAIQRDSPKFKKLVPNYNHDIDFVDNEGTGADRVMTQRCKEKLDILAFSVMNHWPGVLLRVIEGWDEDKQHENDSLHYEGRAVDIITNDRDRSKYGMLARLAVEAGFDWVFYESRAHIHCSVKPDSAHISHVSGCFTSDSTVLTSTGQRKPMSEVVIGDRLLSMNSHGEPIYSEVILFMDRNLELKQEFVQITTENGAVLTLTPAHLVRVWNPLKVLATEYVFADRVEEDDYVFVDDGEGHLRPRRVVDLRAVLRKGVVAPLTAEGTIVVNSVAASCYAIVNSHQLAHWSLAPMRLMATLKHLMPSASSGGGKIAAVHGVDAVRQTSSNQVEQPIGIHWYTKMLYTMKDYVVPKAWRYQ